jgi:hypothetical protein
MPLVFYPQGGGAEHTDGSVDVGAVVSLIHIKHRHLQNTLFLLSNVFLGMGL